MCEALTARYLSLRYYVGITELEAGETAEDARERRRGCHTSPRGGAAWLRICTAASLDIRILAKPATRAEALRLELGFFLDLFSLHWFKVRGGPFAAVAIMPKVAAEIHALLRAGFDGWERAVQERGGEFPHARCHMEDLCFACFGTGHFMRRCPGAQLNDP